MIISEFCIISSNCLITRKQDELPRHHTIAEMNKIIRVSILQYQTVNQFFFFLNQILTANFQNNNLKYYF